MLLPGEDVKFSSPADVGGGYEAFQYRTLLAVSASLGLPYHLVTGDVRQANYSSLRAELVEFRRRVEQLQHGVIAHQLCRPIWARWMETAVLAGSLDLPGFATSPSRWRSVQWIPPRWDWVDPLKDIQADILAVRAGLMTLKEAIARQGYDPAHVLAEIGATNAELDALGIVLDTDPRKATKTGAAVAPAEGDERRELSD